MCESPLPSPSSPGRDRHKTPELNPPRRDTGKRSVATPGRPQGLKGTKYNTVRAGTGGPRRRAKAALNRSLEEQTKVSFISASGST